MKIEQLESWREFILKNKERVNKANDIEFYLRTALNLIQKQQAEIEKKDRMIDEMAEHIDVKCNCIKGFDKCEEIDDPHCADCIKQYFERKAEL